LAGLTTKAIYIPAVTLGKATAVSTSNGSLTIEELGKSTKTINNITNARITKESSITTSLNSIGINDRVAIVSGSNGTHWITVIVPINRTVVSYTSSIKTLVITRVLFSDKNQFVLSDQVYIHKGATSLTADSLT